jgi:lactate dehydrogenase-like 2-hydroxyacid dehydrogenase
MLVLAAARRMREVFRLFYFIYFIFGNSVMIYINFILIKGIRAVYTGTFGGWTATWMLGTCTCVYTLCYFFNSKYIPSFFYLHSGTQLTSKTIGIVGLGRIGYATALRLKPFIGNNGKIIYSGHVEKPIASSLGATKVEFNTLIRESDVICICCALNEETRKMFNYEVFKKMKSNVVCKHSIYVKYVIYHMNNTNKQY